MKEKRETENRYIRCVKCGTQNPIDAKRCRNYSCMANLMIYGVFIHPDAPPKGNSPVGPDLEDEPIIEPESGDESTTDPYPKDEPATEPEPEEGPITEPEPEDDPIAGPESEEEPVVDPGKKKRNRKILMIVVVAAALAAATFGIYYSATLHTTRSRVLMDCSMYLKDYVFGKTTLHRDQIVSITFTDSIADVPDYGLIWDVSEYSNGSVKAWAVSTGETNEDGDKLYDLYIGAEGGVKAPADCGRLFQNFVNVREINFNGCFDTSEVTHMYSMFANCSSLTQLDVSGFDTSQVESMSFMFLWCSSLTGLDLSGFDTSAVTHMHYMFYECESLSELDISGFDTSGVENMSYMFYGCASLTALDLSGFDTSAVTSMDYMLYGISDALEESVSADGFSNFDTGNVEHLINFMDGTDVYDWTVLADDSIVDEDLSSFTSPDKYWGMGR